MDSAGVAAVSFVEGVVERAEDGLDDVDEVDFVEDFDCSEDAKLLFQMGGWRILAESMTDRFFK